MEKSKRISFFKRVKMAIFELENYIEFTNEKLSKAIGYMFKFILISSMIIVIVSSIYVFSKYKSFSQYIDSVVPEFSYENGKFDIDSEDSKKGDKKVVASAMKQLEPSISTVLDGEKYNKDQLIVDIKNNERQIVIATLIALFMDSFIEIMFFWIIISFMTSLIGWIILKFSRVKMHYSKLYALSIYASTVTIMLSVIYVLLNTFLGIYIEMFDYLSMMISYIYITAIIYMIRSDLIKQQMELIRLATIQAKVKEQLKKEDEESNKDKENDTGKEPNEKEKEKDSEENKNGADNNVEDDEPDGSEI